MITKIDSKGRIKLPKEVHSKYPSGQRFLVEIKDHKVVLTPVKSVKAQLEDGTEIEI